jgi:protein-S-isoprenylcysteine O-methyltransferase Ste14
MLTPLLYIFSSQLDFADYTLPSWTGWLGAVLFACAGLLLWKTHQDLGRNWTPGLAFRERHVLVTEGVFRHIRHPMYAAHLLWAISQILLLHNWIAGFSYLAFIVPRYFVRVRNEEKMLLERFGEQYSEYMKTTGRLVPKFIRSHER